MQNICRVCHQTNDGEIEIQRLRQIYQIVSRCENVEVPERMKHHFRYGRNLYITHLHCKFGVQCSKLQMKTQTISNLAMQIENLLVAFVYEKAGSQDYRTVYRLSQGYFPQACHFMEQVRGYAEVK